MLELGICMGFGAWLVWIVGLWVVCFVYARATWTSYVLVDDVRNRSAEDDYYRYHLDELRYFREHRVKPLNDWSDRLWDAIERYVLGLLIRTTVAELASKIASTGFDDQHCAWVRIPIFARTLDYSHGGLPLENFLSALRKKFSGCTVRVNEAGESFVITRVQTCLRASNRRRIGNG